MRLKRIEAPTVAEALRRLRQELGDHAVILHTKTLSRAGLIKEPRVEILGAADDAGVTAAAPAAAPVVTPDPVPLAPAPAAAAPDRRLDIAARLAKFQAAVPSVPLAVPAAAREARAEPSAIPCVPSSWDAVEGRARRIAFVGPTGAGKTTTLAKVAARAQLDHGRRVSLITIDTYRIGAVPQLASYAEILGVPLDVAHSPDDLIRAIERARDSDLVFIDTIGRSPLGPHVDELRSFLEAADADDVHLVLSATTRVADSLRAAASYARLRPNRLCITKLDETDYHEAIPAVSRTTGLPLTWLANGQAVPDDLAEAEPARVAALVGDGWAA